LAWLSKQRPGFQSFIGSRKKKWYNLNLQQTRSI
jgi:hypothetical protein